MADKLLKEDGGRILLEDGSFLEIEATELRSQPLLLAGPIRAIRRLPYSSGAAPVLLVESVAPLSWQAKYPDFARTYRRSPFTYGELNSYQVPPVASGEYANRHGYHHGPILAARRWPYTTGAAPVRPIEDVLPDVQFLDKWLPFYPSFIPRPKVHVSEIPSGPAWNPDTPFYGYVPWPNLPPLPNRRPHFSATYQPPTRIYPPYQIQIQPDMWRGYQPERIDRRRFVTLGVQLGSLQPFPNIAPNPDNWKATYPDFARGRKPLHFLVPAHLAPSPEPLPNVTRVDPSSWLATYPDFARTFKPLYHLAPVYFAPDPIPLPNITRIDPVSWLATYADFARAFSRRPHLQPVEFSWNLPTVPALPDNSTWAAIYVDFARGRKPVYFLVPFFEWYPITPATPSIPTPGEQPPTEPTMWDNTFLHDVEEPGGQYVTPAGKGAFGEQAWQPTAEPEDSWSETSKPGTDWKKEQ